MLARHHRFSDSPARFVMPSASTQRRRSLRYFLGLWPYLFVAVSMVGLAYIAYSALHVAR